MGRRLPFGFLDDVKQRFFSEYGSSTSTAIAYEYNSDFSGQLAQRMDFWSNDPQADAIGRCKTDINEVKGIMVQNIEKVLDRGEKIELLVTRTDALQVRPNRALQRGITVFHVDTSITSSPVTHSRIIACATETCNL